MLEVVGAREVDLVSAMSSVSIELIAVSGALFFFGVGVVTSADCPCPHHTLEPGLAVELGRGHQVEGGYGHHLLVVYVLDEAEVGDGRTVVLLLLMVELDLWVVVLMVVVLAVGCRVEVGVVGSLGLGELLGGDLVVVVSSRSLGMGKDGFPS